MSYHGNFNHRVPYLLQLRRNRVVPMGMFALLVGLMRGRAGLKCALEECGGRCVIVVGAPLMLV